MLIRGTDASRQPENIAKMKFLQHVDLAGCKHLVMLPEGIGKLQQLRYLNLHLSGIDNVPKSFHSLTNLRVLNGFPVHMEGDWCSLEELGPLTKLTSLCSEHGIICHLFEFDFGDS
jgi:hypothetical protein